MEKLEQMSDFFTARVVGYDEHMINDVEGCKECYKKMATLVPLQTENLLDLGCGTGTMAHIMSREGYDVIGIDASPEMLSIAKQKHGDILFLNQSLTEFELYGTVDAAYSSLDCINYLTEDGELSKLFALVKNYLNPGGIYIFDISSYHKLSKVLGNNTFVFEDENIFYTWENYFEDDILEMTLTFFKKNGSLYERFEEEQIQRAYKTDEICSIAEASGLSVLGVFDNLSFADVKNDSERVFFVLRKDDL